MKIGYCVEGSTDRAVLCGFKDRWCPHAQLVQGAFRGTSGLSQRREIPKVCIELIAKGVELIVFLRDANKEDWREVLRTYEGGCRAEHRHLAVFGVCDRNIECWLCADADWIAKETQREAAAFRVDDPKSAFAEAMGLIGFDKKEPEIAALVQRAPLKNWLSNRSFKEFYDRLWAKNKERGCKIENLLQA
jgi:hypothetical protein